MAPSVRIPEDLIAEVVDHLMKLQATSPGRLTTADAFRDLVRKGLKASSSIPTESAWPTFESSPFLPVPGGPYYHYNLDAILAHLKGDLPRTPLHEIIILKAGESIELQASTSKTAGRVTGLFYRQLHDDRESVPSVWHFSIGGDDDLLPYEGGHPLTAWSEGGFFPGNPRSPKLRANPVLRYPNRARVKIKAPSNGDPVIFTLSLLTSDQAPE